MTLFVPGDGAPFRVVAVANSMRRCRANDANHAGGILQQSWVIEWSMRIHLNANNERTQGYHPQAGAIVWFIMVTGRPCNQSECGQSHEPCGTVQAGRNPGGAIHTVRSSMSLYGTLVPLRLLNGWANSTDRSLLAEVVQRKRYYVSTMARTISLDLSAGVRRVLRIYLAKRTPESSAGVRPSGKRRGRVPPQRERRRENYGGSSPSPRRMPSRIDRTICCYVLLSKQ